MVSPGQVGELVPELSWNLTRGGGAAGVIEMAPLAGGKVRSTKLVPGPSGVEHPLKQHQRMSFCLCLSFLPQEVKLSGSQGCLDLLPYIVPREPQTLDICWVSSRPQGRKKERGRKAFEPTALPVVHVTLLFPSVTFCHTAASVLPLVFPGAHHYCTGVGVKWGGSL